MKSFNTWNLTNNKLHQLFKDNKEFISIKVRGNTWEPITRWLRLDSRIFRETTNKARITLCDIESLAEIYNYRPIRWKAKKITPLKTNFLPKIIKNIFRKIWISSWEENQEWCYSRDFSVRALGDRGSKRAKWWLVGC